MHLNSPMRAPAKRVRARAQSCPTAAGSFEDAAGSGYSRLRGAAARKLARAARGDRRCYSPQFWRLEFNLRPHEQDREMARGSPTSKPVEPNATTEAQRAAW